MCADDRVVKAWSICVVAVGVDGRIDFAETVSAGASFYIPAAIIADFG